MAQAIAAFLFSLGSRLRAASGLPATEFAALVRLMASDRLCRFLRMATTVGRNALTRKAQSSGVGEVGSRNRDCPAPESQRLIRLRPPDPRSSLLDSRPSGPRSGLVSQPARRRSVALSGPVAPFFARVTIWRPRRTR